MSKLSSLSRIISASKKISPDFYDKLINDDGIDTKLKKKIKMYYFNDGRLSINLFKIDLKGIKSGGTLPETEPETKLGWNLNNLKLENNVCDFSNSNSKAIFKKEGTNENINFNILTHVGCGSFANVYKVSDNQVIKIYNNCANTVKIKNNIKLFCKTFTDIVQSTCLYIEENEFVWLNTNDSRCGYLMKLLNPINDITIDVCTKSRDLLIKVFENKSEYRFIHGDLKLDNLLLDKDNVVLSDLDGVYIYKNIYPVNADVDMILTPITTHPVYLWYRSNQESFDNHAKLWLLLSNVRNNTIFSKVKQILDVVYEPNYTTYFENLEKTNEIITKTIQYSDLYSLGMSILIKYLTNTVKIDELLFSIQTLQFYKMLCESTDIPSFPEVRDEDLKKIKAILSKNDKNGGHIKNNNDILNSIRISPDLMKELVENLNLKKI